MVNYRPAYCPRCDREYLSGKSYADSIRMMNEHVAMAHPEHRTYLDSLDETPVDNTHSPTNKEN